jgi:ABC-type spermidine/putrescine transport system permease subunit II
MIGLLVMSEESFQAHFDQARLDRLASLVTLPNPIRVDDLDSSAVREQLASVDVLVTSWGVPRAARLDGLSEYGIWARIILPLSKPALASLALLTFVNTWNDYMGPFIYLTDNKLWTIQLGLRSFIGLYDAEFAMIMTGSVLSVLPILVIFLLGQKYFVRGIATSGLK